jgi:hypothetical protein
MPDTFLHAGGTGAVPVLRPADRSRCGARRREWLLSWRPAPPRPGGAATAEPRAAVAPLRFPSLEAALRYAEAQGLRPEICAGKDPGAPRPIRPAGPQPVEPPPPQYWWALRCRAPEPLEEAAAA